MGLEGDGGCEVVGRRCGCRGGWRMLGGRVGVPRLRRGWGDVAGRSVRRLVLKRRRGWGREFWTYGWAGYEIV